MCLKFLRRLFWGQYFHKYVSEFMKNMPFSRSVGSWHAYPYSTCRQVEISFLGMPQIAHFQVEKWKSSLPWTPPFPRSFATLPRAWSLRSFAKIVPPKCFGSLRHCLSHGVNSIRVFLHDRNRHVKHYGWWVMFRPPCVSLKTLLWVSYVCILHGVCKLVCVRSTLQ